MDMSIMLGNIYDIYGHDDEFFFDLWGKLKNPTIALKSSLLQIPMFSVRMSPRCYIHCSIGFLGWPLV
jgi:hypothetical protein